MFDFHIHSCHSHDSKQTLDEICRRAIEIGLDGIAVCDHVDLWFAEELRAEQAIRGCIADVKEAQKKYGSRLTVLQGLEMAEYLDGPETAERILSLCEFDVILGSVHSVRFETIEDSYSRVDFSSMPVERIDGFLKKYFKKISEMLRKKQLRIVRGQHVSNWMVMVASKQR